MMKTFTPNQKNDKITRKLQPQKKTLQTILAFASAYHVETLVSGDILQFIMN